VVATRKHTTMISDLLRAGKISFSWRWSNIPLPEPHIVGILASATLHLVRPWRLPGSKRLYSGVGWALVGARVVISASAVRAASDVDLEQPSTLICSGSYAISRNPMYVSWTLLYVGGALITRNAWMVASVPVVAELIHRDVLREVHTLEQTVGEEYAKYRKQVRRYL
jgi:protein-S-isoprenylcysteine O-methyltransferase Ste14